MAHVKLSKSRKLSLATEFCLQNSVARIDRDVNPFDVAQSLFLNVKLKGLIKKYRIGL